MKPEPQASRDESILILAPAGKDAELAARFMREASLPAKVCENIDELCLGILRGTGVVFITGEALTHEAMQSAMRALVEQPTWSDIPIVVLTNGGSESPDNADALAVFSKVANVSLIERPVRIMTLVSTLKAALRARRRQYQVRDLLESEREAREGAEKASRLKDEFLATVSHELRNPLNVVLGYSEILLRVPQIKESAGLLQMTEALKRNAHAQSQLINDLLDLSRLQMGKIKLDYETVLLTAMIDNAVESVRKEAAEKHITIVVRDCDETLFVEADSLRLQQVAWNLLNNAVKFTPAGGNINISLTRDGDFSVVAIEDTGQGIPPEFLPHVFEMFRQADGRTVRHHSGLGIGLALVRRLVELHGGSVAADSKGSNQGARFTIRLPSTQQAKEPAREPEINAGRLHSMRLLIVDDSEDTVEMLSTLLKMEGASVKIASSGLEALGIVEDKDFDAILSDISMPGMDGFEFLSRLRLLPGKTEVPVLAVTGFGQAEVIARARAAGFASHLTKPLELDGLAKTLENLYQKNVQQKAPAPGIVETQIVALPVKQTI